MRPARLLRRGYCLLHKRGNQLQAGPEQRTSVKKYDEERYGGWKSAEMLFANDVPRKSLIGRADWHIVQFLLALIPPGMLLLLIQWARYDMRKLEERTRLEMLEKESQKLAAVAEHQKQKQQAGKAGAAAGGGVAAVAAGAEAADRGEGVEQRLAQLEALVRALQQQAQQEGGKAAEGQHPAAGGKQQEGQSAAGRQMEDGMQQVLPQQATAVAAEQEQQTAAAGEAQQEQQEAGPSLMQQVAGALRWAGSWLALPSQKQQQQQQQPAEASDAASTGQKAVGDEAAAVSEESSSSACGGSSHDAATAAAAAAAAAAVLGDSAAASPGSAASSSRGATGPVVAAPTANAPGNAANWLLHAAGWPLRWLRSKPAQPDGEVAEEERRLRSWLQQEPEDSE